MFFTHWLQMKQNHAKFTIIKLFLIFVTACLEVELKSSRTEITVIIMHLESKGITFQQSVSSFSTHVKI